MPLSTPLGLEVAKENNVEASLARTTMAPVSPLQLGTNSDRPYASAYHIPRINSSQGLKWEKQASGGNTKYSFVDVAHVLKKVSLDFTATSSAFLAGF
ncbi:hypothetical protein Q8A67_002647 [Cirrhinus molitorella]|uniref:Uncharacterized protein n=1 Tax=Cirrhinus molitorella TaxID=172907 RepID=A0AA88Q496_9TELE|nr:hypothetical protein Q8A67_002647 [Cirrhinus molitorella]